jgi:hypothetical protein
MEIFMSNAAQAGANSLLPWSSLLSKTEGMRLRNLLLALLSSFFVIAFLPARAATELHTFYGDVKAVDLAAKTITIKSSGRTFVFHVTNETKLTSSRGHFTLDKIQLGQGAAVVMRLGPGGIGIAVKIHFRSRSQRGRLAIALWREDHRRRNHYRDGRQ